MKVNSPYIGNGIFFPAFFNVVLDIVFISFLTEIFFAIEANLLRWSENSFSKTSYEIKENHYAIAYHKLLHWCELQLYWKNELQDRRLVMNFAILEKIQRCI